MEARQLTIRHQNLATVQVNYYLMDVELLFSRNPFVQQFSGQFSSIHPNHSTTLALAEKATETKVPLPAELHNRNVLIEVTGGGQTRTQAYYAHSLAIQVIENYGQIRVTHATTQKPVSKAYVKVYAQHADGSVRFYKDGYTDLRGHLEYASLSTNDLETAGKLAKIWWSATNTACSSAKPPRPSDKSLRVRQVAAARDDTRLPITGVS